MSKKIEKEEKKTKVKEQTEPRKEDKARRDIIEIKKARYKSESNIT